MERHGEKHGITFDNSKHTSHFAIDKLLDDKIGKEATCRPGAYTPVLCGPLDVSSYFSAKNFQELSLKLNSEGAVWSGNRFLQWRVMLAQLTDGKQCQCICMM
ncbi:hypothetical protein WA026_007244 [Henosepilachna vigintioctopunctata]|uniref:Uncharacterized protein n=1 Tax=Henosepilachna vigintioctopunctata TaxID=420089 RepID=A0AAW1UTM4_9CUCU